MRGRLLRVARHGHRGASAVFALLRNVRQALDPQTRRSTASEHSHEDWLQAGKVPHRPQSEPCTGKGRLLGRSRLLRILWSVARRDDYGYPRNSNRRREDGRSNSSGLRAPFCGSPLPLGERRSAVRNGRQRVSDLPRFPELRRKNPAKGSTQLAQVFRARWMAGRRAAMAPHLHVDLYRDRTAVYRLPDLQRKLQAGALCEARPAGRVADGAPLFPFRPQAADQGGLQPAPETCVHLCHCVGRAVSADGFRSMETGAVLVAGVDDGRLPLGTAVAFPDHVGDAGLRVRTSGDGGAPWLEQLRLHFDRMEEGPGIPIRIVTVRNCSAFTVRNDAGRSDFAGTSSETIQRRDADPAY